MGLRQWFSDGVRRLRGLPTEAELRDQRDRMYLAEREARFEWLQRHGYRPWLYHYHSFHSPPQREKVSFIYLMQDRAFVASKQDLGPFHNIADLWWRPLHPIEGDMPTTH